MWGREGVGVGWDEEAVGEEEGEGGARADGDDSASLNDNMWSAAPTPKNSEFVGCWDVRA